MMWTIYLALQALLIVVTLYRLTMLSDVCNRREVEPFDPTGIMFYFCIVCLPPILQVMGLKRIFFTVPFIAGVIFHVAANVIIGSTKGNYRIGQFLIVCTGLLSELIPRARNGD